jgi:hypothetical protein
MLRTVTHDWPSAYVIRLLTRLREAALVGKTKLLLVDQVVAYACDDVSELRNIPGATPPSVPAPLLPNLGKANSMAYLGDMQVRCDRRRLCCPTILMRNLQMFDFGGQERTLGNHCHCTKESGWKIIHVYTSPGSIFKHILAEAV